MKTKLFVKGGGFKGLFAAGAVFVLLASAQSLFAVAQWTKTFPKGTNVFGACEFNTDGKKEYIAVSNTTCNVYAGAN